MQRWLRSLSTLARAHNPSRYSSRTTLSSGRSRGGGDPRDYARLRRFCSVGERDISLEEDVERKTGWLLKLIFVATAGAVGYQFFPYMGDNLLQQSISLLHVKDPLFKRMGASRLSRYAIDDERRMKVVEMGGAQDLLNMLEAAKDGKTRKEALKALAALSHSDLVAEVLRQAGAVPVVSSIPHSGEHPEVEAYKSSLLKRFEEFERDCTPAEGKLN
ncbi:uncharacterized protein M6B38_414065 [Iris pallida]|uniref:ARM repeat superfamily protein n=1 Tax=Iris pallida TaxID=29817 RepID=A0AAX6FL70_IRIPA|nr:uncharacterized protein M6B38_414065 [Iris pallida]